MYQFLYIYSLSLKRDPERTAVWFNTTVLPLMWKTTVVDVDVWVCACPGPITFSVLLKGYGRQHRTTKVVDVMSTMRTRGVVPDVVALNAAVDAFVR